MPRLSTVKQDLTTAARNLIDLLLRRIAGEETGSVVMPPGLVVRMSSRCACAGTYIIDHRAHLQTEVLADHGKSER